VVRATHAGSGIRLFTFWNGHRSTCAIRAFAIFEESTSVRRGAERRQDRQAAGEWYRVKWRAGTVGHVDYHCRHSRELGRFQACRSAGQDKLAFSATKFKSGSEPKVRELSVGLTRSNLSVRQQES
jgi:hypothetical protein